MNHHFKYEQCDIPEGKTLGEHRRARHAPVDETPRRRGLLRILAARRRAARVAA